MSNKNEIADLIEGCRRQQRVAQKELYLLFADSLMKVAIRYAKDIAQAKDLVHDTFIKCFTKIDKYKDIGSNFESWLKRILINEALQSFRKQKRMVPIEDVELIEFAADTETIIENLEAEDLLNVIKTLPKGCQLVFNLYVIEGFKHTEIAKMLNINASASRSQLTRAKKLLQSKIKRKMSVKDFNV